MGELTTTAVKPNAGFRGATQAQRSLEGSTATVVPVPKPKPQKVERVAGTAPKPDVSLAAAITPPGSPQERYAAALRRYEAAYKDWNDTTAAPYWNRNDAHRDQRNARLIDMAKDGLQMTEVGAGPWIAEQPPNYTGPAKPKPSDFGLPPEPGTAPVNTSTLVAAARGQGYLSRLDILPGDAEKPQADAFEARFLRNYAQAAISAGIPRKALLDVFAVEVGGKGRHNEMHPNSAALGFAQLLPANTMDTLLEKGTGIAARLRARGLDAKADLVTQMKSDVMNAVAAARARVIESGGKPPKTWNLLMGMARTPLGYGTHAANLDSDIGPELQTTKLRVTADQFRAYSRGRAGDQPSPRVLTGEVLEAMNLAGPVNGYALSDPENAKRLTVNFFLRGGYNGNKGLTAEDDGLYARSAEGLMLRMTEIMNGPNTKGASYRQLDSIYRKLAGEPPRTD